MSIASYTDAELIFAVTNSNNIADVLKHLNLGYYGGNYRTINNSIKRLSISLEHFTGKKNKVGQINKKFSLEEIMIENSFYTSISTLKRRLLKDKILECKCVECGVTDTYNNKPIVLHLDHINGISNDHRIENLRLLCPNCHSQTDTYAGKNIKTNRKIIVPKPAMPRESKRKNNKCIECQIHCRGKRCKKCSELHIVRHKKIEWPSIEILLKKLEITPFTTLAKELGVSDNAIRGHIKRHKK